MKIVQVIESHGALGRNGKGVGSIVLAEDGSVWRLDWVHDGPRWGPVPLPPLPDPVTLALVASSADG